IVVAAPPRGVAGSTRLRKLALTDSPAIPPPGSPPAQSRGAPLHPAASPAQPVCGNWPSPVRRRFRLRGRPPRIRAGPRSTLRRRRLNPFAEAGPHRFAGYSASGVACAFARGPAPPCGVAGSTRLRKLALTGSPAIPPPGSPPAHSRGAPLHPAASPAQPVCGNLPSPVRRLFRLRGRLRIRAGPRSTLRRRRLNPFAETGPHRFAGYSASGVAPRAFARGPAPPCGVAGSTRLRKLALTDSPAIPPPGSPPRIRAGPRSTLRRRRLNPFAETGPHRFAGYSASGVACAFARGPAPPCGVAGSTRLRKLALTGSPAIPPPRSPPAHSRGAPLHPAASYSVKANSLTTAPGRRMLLTLRAR